MGMTREEQAAMFTRGKGIAPEDRNFLQNGPRLDASAKSFFMLPKEDESANAFKQDPMNLNGLPPEVVRQKMAFLR